jgi:hypothetical protein
MVRGDEKRQRIEGGLRIEIPLRTRTQQGRLDFFEAKRRGWFSRRHFFKERIRADVQDALNGVEVARQKVVVAAQEVKASKSWQRAS